MAHKIILDFRERRNARKWKHEEGAKIHKPDGHRAITDNGWIPTKRLKKGTYGLIKKHEGGGPIDKDKYVSNEYMNNYPNIITILGLHSSDPNPQVIGWDGDHAETVPNELARKIYNFNLVDSAMYTPILNKLETYLTNKKEFNPQEEINLKALALGLESVYNGLEYNYTDGHKMINSKIDKITDDDITRLLNTKDLFHIGLKKAIKLLPKKFSAKDILLIIKYASSGGFLKDYSALSSFGYNIRKNLVEDDPEKWKEFIYKKGGSITTFKKPAGPLKPSRNWDTTLTGKLINFSENPDSIGWDAKNRRWYAPPAGKGYDTNLFGMGVDRNQTPGFKERVKRDNKGREYLTVDDERYLRHMAIDRANESANTRYRFAQKASKIKGAVSPKHDAITVSAIYNLGPGHMARTVFENSKAMKSIFNRNSSEYQNHIHKLYKLKGRNERIQNELKFFKLNGL